MADLLDVAASFVGLINAGDVEGIVRSLTPDSRFFVEGEAPTQGRDSLRVAWSGYFASFPSYRVYIDETHEKSDAAYLIGHTSGSHVPAELESQPSSVIWRCEIVDGQVSEWSIFPASKAHRARFGLPGGARGADNAHRVEHDD